MNNYFIRGDEVVSKSEAAQDHTNLRVALISVYGVNCGISTYAEALWEHMAPRVKEIKIFAEIEENATERDDIIRCWQRGKPLIALADAIKEYNPDVIYIQHEYGPFPIARHWLAFMGALSGYRVITTLHSVYASHWDKTVVEASCPEIVVHTQSAYDTLMHVKQISSKVNIIPHGCEPCTDASKFWNIYHSAHTILQFGFGFPYKGWNNSLDIVAALKTTYPDIFFTGLMSERWSGTHIEYVRELNAYARKLGISENVGLIRGFQSDPVLNSYFRVNRIALFPYRDNGEHTVLGCSGAARLAMSKGMPVVASGVPLFEDLEGVVARPTTVEGWAEAISQLFENPKPQLLKQNEFLEENSWDIIANKYLNLI
jgi:glycosyltransferase involved in cell wall biosynthesis